MSQTLAILGDTYRGLKARKMFWIVLGISSLVVASFGCLGINDKGLKLLVWDMGFGPSTRDLSAEMFYKSLFVGLGINIWLSSLATILALISTAGTFPAFLARGAIDLVVSRPISRLRLFLTQYAAGLLFVSLQITIFSGASFLVMGLRGGAWEPGIFLAVPLVVCFFSYLFSVCTLLGLLTRSTVAALLLTLLFWLLLAGLHAADTGLLLAQQAQPVAKEQIDGQHETEDETLRNLAAAHRIVYGVKSFLPKTAETIDLLERTLIRTAELPRPQGGRQTGTPGLDRAAQQVVYRMRARSAGRIIGTSLAFEAAILGLGAWIFSRKDL